jgi:hypothetical protein
MDCLSTKTTHLITREVTVNKNGKKNMSFCLKIVLSQIDIMIFINLDRADQKLKSTHTVYLCSKKLFS